MVFRRGVARRFPIFALLVFQPARAALLFGLSGHIDKGLASSLYEVSSFLDVALQLMVVAELGAAPHPRHGRVDPGFAFFSASRWRALQPSSHGSAHVVPNRIFNDRLQLFAWFVLLALFGVVLKGSRSANLTRISAGFAVFSLMQFSTLAGRTAPFLHRDAGQYVAWFYLPAVGYLAIVVFWLIALQNESEQIRTRSKRAVSRNTPENLAQAIKMRAMFGFGSKNPGR